MSKTAFTFNVTFATSRDMEKEVADYIRNSFMPALFKEGSEASNPRFMKVAEIGGEVPAEEHGVSMALSADFPGEEEARNWQLKSLFPALQKLNAKFSHQAPFFVTLLENISL